MRFKQFVSEMESITMAMDSGDLVDVINQRLDPGSSWARCRVSAGSPLGFLEDS